MECIYCGHRTKVTNSRPSKKDHQTWRRRECLSCHATVTSVESVDLHGSLRVEKRNGSIQPFERDKVFVSIYKAIDHLHNPISIANSLTNTVLRHLLQVKPLDPIVPTTEIAKQCATTLRRYNAASSVRYLSFQTTMQLPNDVRRTLK